jgi:hypothetical protein
MAKVTGPLYSMTASGKIADAMVFFGWKGINVVRQWLIPTNKKTEDQGDARQILGGLGRAAIAAKADSLYRVDATANISGTNTWVSQFVKYVRLNLMADATAFEAELTEFNGHGAVATFNTQALALGLSSLAIEYRGTTNSFSCGLQLYELAKYAIAVHAANPDLFDRAPYTTALASWNQNNVGDFVTDLEAVV